MVPIYKTRAILQAYIAYLYLYNIFLMMPQRFGTKMQKDFLLGKEVISVPCIILAPTLPREFIVVEWTKLSTLQYKRNGRVQSVQCWFLQQSITIKDSDRFQPRQKSGQYFSTILVLSEAAGQEERDKARGVQDK